MEDRQDEGLHDDGPGRSKPTRPDGSGGIDGCVGERLLMGVDVQDRGTDVRRRVVEGTLRGSPQDAERRPADLVAAVAKVKQHPPQVGEPGLRAWLA